MTIRIRKVSDDLYHVEAIAAQWRGGEKWTSSEPLNHKQLVKELTQRGFHIQDIVDALAEEDPAWANKLIDENGH